MFKLEMIHDLKMVALSKLAAALEKETDPRLREILSQQIDTLVAK